MYEKNLSKIRYGIMQVSLRIYFILCFLSGKHQNIFYFSLPASMDLHKVRYRYYVFMRLFNYSEFQVQDTGYRGLLVSHRFTYDVHCYVFFLFSLLLFMGVLTTCHHVMSSVTIGSELQKQVDNLNLENEKTRKTLVTLVEAVSLTKIFVFILQ